MPIRDADHSRPAPSAVRADPDLVRCEWAGRRLPVNSAGRRGAHGTVRMMDDEDDLAVVLSDVARSLEGREGIEETLHGIVAAAVGTVPGAQYAGITAVEGRT